MMTHDYLVKHERVSHREDPELNFMGTVTAVNTDESGEKTYDVAWEGDEESNGTYSRGELVARHDNDAIADFNKRTEHAPSIVHAIDHFTWFKAWRTAANRMEVIDFLSEVHTALWGPSPFMACEYCQADSQRLEDVRREAREASRGTFLLVEAAPPQFSLARGNQPIRRMEDL